LFIRQVSRENFSGLTPTSALNRVIFYLKPFKKPPEQPVEALALSKFMDEIRATVPKALQPAVDQIVLEFERRVNKEGRTERRPIRR